MPLDGIQQVTQPKHDLSTGLFDFDIEMRPLFYGQPRALGDNHPHTSMAGVPTDKAQALVRNDTNQVLGIHSRRYKPTRYTNSLRAVSQALMQCPHIDVTDIDVNDELFDGGARMCRRIVFHKHMIEPQVGDIVKLMLVVRDSYDGNWAFQLDFSAMRLWCLNGCTTADFTLRSYHKHTKAINVGLEADKITDAISAFENREKEFRLWIGKKVSNDAVKDLFSYTLASYKARTGEMTVSERTLSDLLVRYQDEQRSMGPTIWSVYNAATNWSSHPGDKIRGAAQNVLLHRESKVAKMLRSERWALLTA